MLNRLVANWVYGGFSAGILLLLLAPILLHGWCPALAVTFLCLPVYMIHQYEEHDNDRFRRLLNQTLGRGANVLPLGAVFLINVPGVWGVIAVSLWLAVSVNIGFASIAVYLLLVNAVIHIAHAMFFRSYNPGLGTAILLFLPVGSLGVWEIQRAGGTVGTGVVGLIVAIGIHVVIIAYVLHNRRIAGVEMR